MNAAIITTTVPARAARSSWRQTTTLTAVGALLGLAWASSLRGWMTQLAGPASVVTWTGTFIGVLLPGVLVGVLLGWAEHQRRSGGARRGWLVLAPLLFPAMALSLPGAMQRFLTAGIGGGAFGIVLLGMLGGFALSGRGPGWARFGCGVAAFALVPAWFFFGQLMRPELDATTPLGAWVATNFSALFLTLAMACSVPLRRAPGGAAG